MNESAAAEPRPRRFDVALDACLVWVALFLAYLVVGGLLGWRAVRAVLRFLRVRRGDRLDF